MSRFPLFLVVLVALLHSCLSAEYTLSVDPVYGQDISACITATGSDPEIVQPNVTCKSIAYALSPITSSDFLRELSLLPGVYTGTSNTNINLNVITSTWIGHIVVDEWPIIDCDYQASAVTIALSQPSTQSFEFDNIHFRNCQGSTGAAVQISQGVQSTLFSNCIFSNNHATGDGGAIQASNTAGGGVSVQNCVFTNNSATANGGAIAVQGYSLSVSYSSFEKNSADVGGAIYGNNLGADNSTLIFMANNFTNNVVKTMGGAFFATSATNRIYTFYQSNIDNNCATSIYTDSVDVQLRCASTTATCSFTDKGNVTGCLATYVPPSTSSSDEGGISDKNRAIIIGVVVPFSVLAIIAIGVFLYVRKGHNAEMEKRDDYRKKILKALDNMAPEEQEAARLEAERADPKTPKCKLCQTRPILTPLPCGHEIVCSVCRTILLECPVKGCKRSTR